MPPPPPPSLLSPLINSGDCSIILAALLSLLLVIFFVLLLHVYSKCFLTRSIHRNTNSQFRHDHHTNRNSITHFRSRPRYSYSDTKGLELSDISDIPSFTHKASEFVSVLECIICLSAFEDGELGKKLRNCGHCFHVDCIDMWLYSHMSCPICREPVICKGGEMAEIVEEIRDENVMVCDSSASSSSSSSLSDKIMASKNGDVEVKVHSLSDEIEV